MSETRLKNWKNKKHRLTFRVYDAETEPDWSTPCMNCEQVPTVPITSMCGPCTFGESDTIDGNW